MRPLDFSKLRSVELICAHLQTTPEQLRSFIEQPDQFYQAIQLSSPRRSRAPRTVFAIAPPLRRLHRIVAVALDPHLDRLPAHVQAYRRDRRAPRRRIFGILGNAKRHTNAEMVVTADVRAFFDHIILDGVVDVFLRVGAPRQAALLLGRLTTYQGRLPQGGRASPAISNLAVRSLDRLLLRLAGASTYSRYADDLTFSGRTDECPTEAQLEAALAQHGFKLRPGSYKRQSRAAGQIVTGLSLFHSKPTLTRKKRRAIERQLYYGQRFGMTSHLEHIKSTAAADDVLKLLEGRINAVGGVDRHLRRKWLKRLEKVTI